jgi:uncharacterized coiled-coil protein SlyX
MTGLIVAGFHRSGTSSVAQILDSLGLHLGDDLMAGNEFNRFGHFESWPVVRFHDAVLERLGVDWAVPLEDPVMLTDEERQWIVDYVAQRERKDRDWALKDPRMCRFMHLWKDLVPDLRFLIIYRSPAACCQSLIRRANVLMARSGDTDAIERRFYHDPDLALKLWVEHNRHLVAMQRAYPDDCVVLGHHHVLDGYDMLPALDRRLGICATQTPEQTLDAKALSAKRSALYCGSQALIDAALQLWQDFEDADIALAEGWPPLDARASLVHDPVGNHARAWMTGIQIPELYKCLSEERARLAKLDEEVEAQRAVIEDQNTQLAQQRAVIAEQASRLLALQTQIDDSLALAHDARTLARKASRQPFALYFMKRRKYRDIIDKVLAR